MSCISNHCISAQCLFLNLQVRADWVSDAFTRLFATKKSSPTVSLDYKGPTKPMQRGKRQQPFQDGYIAAKPLGSTPLVAADTDVDSAEDVQSAGLLGYLKGAIGRIMSNNFSSDDRSTGITGLKGNIRHQQRGGKDKG